MKIIHRFHYLTQDLPDISHEELTEIACNNGIQWVQLRVKNKPYEEWLRIAAAVREITSKYTAVLIVNDHVEIAAEVKADGVHLGRGDMSVEKARKILGADKIIGGTANTIEDVEVLQQFGADYIGMGPFRFTSTKENLSPVLGIEGYKELFNFNFHLSTPIIAIGGIQVEDVSLLLQSGLHGVAVSSAINLAQDRPAVIKAFLGQFSLTRR